MGSILRDKILTSADIFLKQGFLKYAHNYRKDLVVSLPQQHINILNVRLGLLGCMYLLTFIINLLYY